MSDKDRPVIPDSELPAKQPLTEEQFKQDVQQKMKGFDLTNAFENAIKSLEKHGIEGFFKDPKGVIADALLGMAKDGKFQLPADNNEPKKLTDGKD